MSCQSQATVRRSQICWMQDLSIDTRTQELAMRMAEQMLNERAEQLASERVKTILYTSPAPCDCALLTSSTEGNVRGLVQRD